MSPRRRRRTLAALALLPTLACAIPLLDTVDEHDDDAIDEQAHELETPVATLVPSSDEQLLAKTDEPEPTPGPDEPAPEPEPEPEPQPLTPEQLSALLDEADRAIDALGINSEARRRPKGPLPAASELSQAYAQGRAMVLEGRVEQIRQWAALAKFGSREPGPRCGNSALARYDLIVTREARSKKDLAYLHVVAPATGLPGLGQRGRHEAWIGDERWINLGDRLEPGVDYLPFKTNANESLHKQWGKHEVVEALVGIAAEYRQRTGLLLGIGDLSEVTGGKIEDHWTHQHGADVDLYVVDPSETDAKGRPRVWWSHVQRSGVSVYASEEKGKGKKEPKLDPEDELSHTATSQRLEVLAQIVFMIDGVAYFVHNDTRVLAPFDTQVSSRRAGRRYLHAKNRGLWPTHADHVHLRWVEGKLPVGETPRP